MTQELPEGTVTILFTDVVGSTELTNRLGDDAAREILGAWDELVRQQVGQAGAGRREAQQFRGGPILSAHSELPPTCVNPEASRS